SADDSLRLTVDDHHVEHLGLGKHLDCSGGDLAAEGGITAEQQLLAGLPARIKSAGNLRAAERAIREVAAVFSSERHALRDALVDNIAADLAKPVDIRFARTKIAALDCVVEQTVNAVAVVLIIFRGVDSTLCGDGM